MRNTIFNIQSSMVFKIRKRQIKKKRQTLLTICQMKEYEYEELYKYRVLQTPSFGDILVLGRKKEYEIKIGQSSEIMNIVSIH